MIEKIKIRLQENIDTINSILGDSEFVEKISNAAEIIIHVLKNGNKIFFCGNGGSAADAQHLAAELLGKFYIDREPLPAIALTTNTSVLTAIGNDYSYDEIFVRQLKGLGISGDVLVGISTSGNSKNVIKAMEYAKKAGIKTIALTGKTGGIMKEYADVLLNVPSTDTPRIQEAHILIGHIICEIVEEQLFSNNR